MLRKSLAVAVILLFIGVAFAPSISADVNEPIVDTSQEDDATPIALVFQLIAKLRNNREIQELEENIDSVDDIQDEISMIIERDEELNSIVEQLTVEDCGCKDDSSEFEWRFPIVCFFLAYLHVFAFILVVLGINSQLFFIIGNIGESFNCRWA